MTGQRQRDHNAADNNNIYRITLHSRDNNCTPLCECAKIQFGSTASTVLFCKFFCDINAFHRTLEC